MRKVGVYGEGACIFVRRTGGEDEVGGIIRRRCMHICESDWREG